MENWRKHLNGDPLPWLLDPENPSVRYWTLVDILDRPAGDLEVQETRATIAHRPFVKELFALQHPEGYCGGDDRRGGYSFAFLIQDMSTDDALDCGRYQHRDCLWGAIAALNGLTVLPVDMRSEKSKRVVNLLADALLDARYDFVGEHKRWLTFGVPRAWDLLSALKALAAHGYVHDSRFVPLLKLMLNRP